MTIRLIVMELGKFTSFYIASGAIRVCFHYCTQADSVPGGRAIAAKRSDCQLTIEN
jgi:hypothetical protein